MARSCEGEQWAAHQVESLHPALPVHRGISARSEEWQCGQSVPTGVWRRRRRRRRRGEECGGLTPQVLISGGHLAVVNSVDVYVTYGVL